MRYKQYLTEGYNRSKSISKELAIELIKSNCRDALKGTPIYRGVRNFNTEYLYIDPSKYNRISANTSNYYTLINDNSPYWKKYPKRSKSIICSTDINQISMYGDGNFRVLPYDGAKIGVCPSRDYWVSFEKQDIPILNQFNDDLFDLMSKKYIFIDETYKSIVDSFNKFSKLIYDDKSVLDNLGDYDYMFKDYNVKEGFLKHIERMFDPKKNGFKLAKAGDKIPQQREVWTDSESILVNTGNVIELKREGLL